MELYESRVAALQVKRDEISQEQLEQAHDAVVQDELLREIETSQVGRGALRACMALVKRRPANAQAHAWLCVLEPCARGTSMLHDAHVGA